MESARLSCVAPRFFSSSRADLLNPLSSLSPHLSLFDAHRTGAGARFASAASPTPTTSATSSRSSRSAPLTSPTQVPLRILVPPRPPRPPSSSTRTTLSRTCRAEERVARSRRPTWLPSRGRPTLFLRPSLPPLLTARKTRRTTLRRLRRRRWTHTSLRRLPLCRSIICLLRPSRTSRATRPARSSLTTTRLSTLRPRLSPHPSRPSSGAPRPRRTLVRFRSLRPPRRSRRVVPRARRARASSPPTRRCARRRRSARGLGKP